VSFRLFDVAEASDYEAVAAVLADTYPEMPPSIEAMRHEETLWDSSRYWRIRLIGHDAAGEPIAYVNVSHMPWQFAPNRYRTEIHVIHRARRAGIGRAVASWVEATLRGRHAETVRTEVKADDARSVAFAHARDYVERQQNWESRLNVATFDDACFAEHVRRVDADGVVIRTLSEMLDGADDQRREAIIAGYYALDAEATRDEPALDPITPQPIKTWRGFAIDGPEALPDATFLAIDGDEMVGLCALFRYLAMPGVLNQGFTAIARSHRGRGIAQALKARTVAYARAGGFHEIRTWNNSRNVPMLRINEAMGFVRQPAWITLVRDFATAEPTP
jgi:RimJ/RimL family protein N-acetyltransferase